MNKTKINALNALVFLLGSSLMFSCSSDDDTLAKQLVIDGEKSTLVNGYIDNYGTGTDDNGDRVSEYGIMLTSGTLEISEEGAASGTGSLIFMQLISPSSIELKNGEYTINESESYLKSTAYSIVLTDYNTELAKYYFSKSGKIKISKSGSTYKITFDLIMQFYEGEVAVDVPVKGSYEGKLEIVYLD